MLISLSIRNFILIESVDLEFQSGFTVITGETGAGKSILIDALLCALGDRMQGDIIKKGSEKGYVEAVFHLPPTMNIPHKYIEEGYIQATTDKDRIVIIRREFTSKGINRSFINDSPATASMARTLGEFLIDFHGQHEHQSLLNSDSHLRYLDAFANTDNDYEAYHEQWILVRDRVKKHEDLVRRRDDILRNKDQIHFALQEIEDISPIEGELEQLEQELGKIQYAAFIAEKQYAISQLIHDDDDSIQTLIGKVRAMLEELCKIDTEYDIALKELISAHASVQEIYSIIKEKQSDECIDPDFIQERIAKLIRLKKKYGGFDKVFEIWNTLKEQAHISEDIDSEILKSAETLVHEQKQLGIKGSILSKKRIDKFQGLSSSIEHSLKLMGIEHPTFIISHTQELLAISDITQMKAIIDQQEFIAHSHGIDFIEFWISLNKGEECKPLAKAASGGEISRIMLSLKSLINDMAGVPVMVFDEIDTGISGKVARKVGEVMHVLGSEKQIIAISHSPQISSLANHHIMVKKTSEQDTTTVKARYIHDDERVHEIASLISGTTITQSAIESAKELLSAQDLEKG